MISSAAIDVLRQITEKYTLIVGAARRQSVEELDHAGAPTVYPVLVQMDKNIDLFQEMKRRKLPDGWDAIFLEPWATPEIIGRPLGETNPLAAPLEIRQTTDPVRLPCGK